MKRRTLLTAMAAAPVMSTVAACGSRSVAGSASSNSPGSGSLAFDADNYSTQTLTVSTGDGEKEVSYRLYENIPYVADPVDATYQSLNVSVPVTVDGKAVDATNAPILLNLNIGGYMSSTPGGSGAPGGGTPPTGAAPSATPSDGSGGVASGSGSQVGAGGQQVSNGDLALAAGYVVVSPGARGRDNVTSDGTYYGKAPAAIVDLKAAVRYVRFNRDRIPGNTDWIISTGSSAGGALSTLLGASGDSPLYDSYLTELGAADTSDAIFASAGYCPITDLDHADMAYEWMFGGVPLRSSGDVVDQTVSKQLSAAYARYLASLKLKGESGFGTLTARNYDEYLLQAYLQPAASTHLAALSDSDRSSYLAENSWISWSGRRATFDVDGFRAHVGRSKGVPAFDGFDLTSAENIEFGNETTDARHFTLYSLRHGGDNGAQLDDDLPTKINLMNPMYFIGKRNRSRAKHWFLRVGTSDTDTSLSIVGNLATGLRNLGDDVDALMYWDGGHGANDDPEAFIAWIGEITGYRPA
jgi:hypothetical protein